MFARAPLLLKPLNGSTDIAHQIGAQVEDWTTRRATCRSSHSRCVRRARDAACRQRFEQYSASGLSPKGIGAKQRAHFSGGRSPARPERSRKRARDAACRQSFEQYLASLRASGAIAPPQRSHTRAGGTGTASAPGDVSCDVSLRDETGIRTRGLGMRTSLNSWPPSVPELTTSRLVTSQRTIPTIRG